MREYIISVDQSTQGTKAILFDEKGNIIKRIDKKHEQIIDEAGYVSHNPLEIYHNLIQTVQDLIRSTGIDKNEVKALGISNQRETTVIWDKKGHPLANAVVWQCDRAKDIATRYESHWDFIYDVTGLPLSPYFPACKMRWLLENTEIDGPFCFGTIDSWLIYCLTNKKEFKTDYSNASRTQLFDIHEGKWSRELCDLFEIPMESLPEVCDSDACFGYTDFEGFLDHPIPIHGVLGDSHAALFGQGCHQRGMVKITLGTGSSIMMNIGKEYKKSCNGLASSLAWRINGQTEYVFEGNINYAGAVITWLQNDLNLISNTSELDDAIQNCNMEDETILIPAFTGLSAPYWKDDARAMFYGMSRKTRKNELIKAAVESIAYQIADILYAMASDSGISLSQVKADGGPSKNPYLMQFLSDMARTQVSVSVREELSAIGAAYLTGIAIGLYDKEELFSHLDYQDYTTKMPVTEWNMKMERWYKAVQVLLRKDDKIERENYVTSC